MVFKEIIFQNRYVALETPSRPPPFMEKSILNFHFDYLHPSLSLQAARKRHLCPQNFEGVWSSMSDSLHYSMNKVQAFAMSLFMSLSKADRAWTKNKRTNKFISTPKVLLNNNRCSAGKLINLSRQQKC